MRRNPPRRATGGAAHEACLGPRRSSPSGVERRLGGELPAERTIAVGDRRPRRRSTPSAAKLLHPARPSTRGASGGGSACGDRYGVGSAGALPLDRRSSASGLAGEVEARHVISQTGAEVAELPASPDRSGVTPVQRFPAGGFDARRSRPRAPAPNSPPPPRRRSHKGRRRPPPPPSSHPAAVVVAVAAVHVVVVGHQRAVAPARRRDAPTAAGRREASVADASAPAPRVATARRRRDAMAALHPAPAHAGRAGGDVADCSRRRGRRRGRHPPPRSPPPRKLRGGRTARGGFGFAIRALRARFRRRLVAAPGRPGSTGAAAGAPERRRRGRAPAPLPPNSVGAVAVPRHPPLPPTDVPQTAFLPSVAGFAPSARP